MLDFIKTRRDFIKSGGFLMVGFSLADHMNPGLAEDQREKTKPVDLEDVDSFLAVTADQKVTCTRAR